MRRSAWVVVVIYLTGLVGFREIICRSHKHHFHTEKIIATNNASITSNELGIGLDIISALNLNSNIRGVNQVPGPTPGTLAWRFHSAFDQVQVPPSIVNKLISLWRGDEISFYFVLRQHKKTIATLVSINSPGKMSPWLRLTSNLKNGQQLILFYHILEDNKLHQTSFSVPRAQNWTEILLVVSGDEAKLYFDCDRILSLKLVGRINLHFPKDALIYFRQEPGYKKKFLGVVKTAKMYSYVIPYPANCSGINHE